MPVATGTQHAEPLRPDQRWKGGQPVDEAGIVALGGDLAAQRAGYDVYGLGKHLAAAFGAMRQRNRRVAVASLQELPARAKALHA